MNGFRCLIAPTLILIVSIQCGKCANQSTRSGSDANANEVVSLNIPTVTIYQVLPAEGATLFCGRSSKLLVDMAAAPAIDESFETTLQVTVNYRRLFPGKLLLTTGVTASGRWTWDLCPSEPILNVQLDVVGIGLKSGRHYIFASVKRTYFVECPCRQKYHIGWCRFRCRRVR
jgi:hypothetical protein